MYSQTEIRLNISKIRRLAPPYLRLQFLGWPLGGTSIAVGVEYVNELIRPFTNVRPAAAVVLRRFRKALAGLKLFHLVGGIRMLKYGRRSRREIQIFYVVCVSRPRIGIYIVYVHVKINRPVRRT